MTAFLWWALFGLIALSAALAAAVADSADEITRLTQNCNCARDLRAVCEQCQDQHAA